MRNYLILLAAIAFTSSAQADPFAGGDPKAGKRLVEKYCVACHARSHGGDGSAIYTRPDRRVKSAQGLLSQIRICNTNLGLKWFEEEELHVARYLNDKYYHFEQ
ncbi:MAG: cytochrome c [Methylophilaceae bacterium]|nr:cytochrome c [Methylophilaceae bacterium]